MASESLEPGLKQRSFFFGFCSSLTPQKMLPPGRSGFGVVSGKALFVVYHPLNIFAARHDTIFRTPLFLFSAALLGVARSVAYLHTGSLWPPVVIHWIVVAVWLVLLGGCGKLYP